MQPLTEEFLFSVQACKRAEILLSTGDRSKPIYYVVLGADINTAIDIRDVDGQIVAHAPTPDILDCYHQRDFWLTWSDGAIVVGEGNQYTNVLMHYTMLNQETITELSLTTKNETYGEWDFSIYNGENPCRLAPFASPCYCTASHDIGRVTQLRFFCLIAMMANAFTSPGQLHPSTWYDLLHLTVTDRNYIVFSVKLCKDAYITLSEIAGLTLYNTYEIIIGYQENSESLILYERGGERLVTVQTPGILDCNKPELFWVSWDGPIQNSIDVGRGSVVGDRVFMSTPTEHTFRINSVAIASGYTETGDWEFRQLKGEESVHDVRTFIFQKCFVLHTKVCVSFFLLIYGTTGPMYTVRTPSEDYQYDHLWVVPHDHYLEFELMACSDGHIALAETPGIWTEGTYEIVIGGWTNSK